MFSKEKLEWELCFASPQIAEHLKYGIMKFLSPYVMKELEDKNRELFVPPTSYVRFNLDTAAFTPEQLPYARTIITASAIFAQEAASKLMSDMIRKAGAVTSIHIFFRNAEMERYKKAYEVEFIACPYFESPPEYPSIADIEKIKKSISISEK